MRFIGYVLQTGGLLPFLSVYDNIGLCLNGLGMPAHEAITSTAERLGIEHHLQKYPGQLSVGERQRVAIARAIVLLGDIPDSPTIENQVRPADPLEVPTHRKSSLAATHHNRVEMFSHSGAFGPGPG